MLYLLNRLIEVVIAIVFALSLIIMGKERSKRGQ